MCASKARTISIREVSFDQEAFSRKEVLGGNTRMNKRLLKRHKRQVARAKEAVKRSEPDVRTAEQLAAAREASRAVTGRRNALRPHYSTPPSNRADGAGTGAVRENVDL